MTATVNYLGARSVSGKRAEEEVLKTRQLSRLLRSALSAKFPANSGWTLTGPGRRLWHLDHRRPIDSFPNLAHDPEQQAICFHISNLQPLSAFDNLSKNSKYDPRDFEDEWIYANGYKWRICDDMRTKL